MFTRHELLNYVLAVLIAWGFPLVNNKVWSKQTAARLPNAAEGKVVLLSGATTTHPLYRDSSILHTYRRTSFSLPQSSVFVYN